MAEWIGGHGLTYRTATVDLGLEGDVTVSYDALGITVDCSRENRGKAHLDLRQASELLTVLSQAIYFAIDDDRE
jgi:hypothetical protein